MRIKFDSKEMRGHVNHMKRRISRLRLRLNPTGAVAVGLFAFCVMFFLGTLVPMSKELDRGNPIDESAGSAGDLKSQAAGYHAELADFYERLAPLSSLPKWLEEFHQLAKSPNVQMSIGKFRLAQTGDEQSPIWRYEMEFTTHTSYSKTRELLSQVVALNSTISLDEIVFQRKQSEADSIDAKIRMSLYFVQH
jgi:hypothetical protein